MWKHLPHISITALPSYSHHAPGSHLRLSPSHRWFELIIRSTDPFKVPYAEGRIKVVNAGAAATTSQFMSEWLCLLLPSPPSPDEGIDVRSHPPEPSPEPSSYLSNSGLCHSQRLPEETDIAFV